MSIYVKLLAAALSGLRQGGTGLGWLAAPLSRRCSARAALATVAAASAAEAP
eukprot:COSAG06_NODE_14237_length_1175_cov_117.853160_1_plen_51_part_10